MIRFLLTAANELGNRFFIVVGQNFDHCFIRDFLIVRTAQIAQIALGITDKHVFFRIQVLHITGKQLKRIKDQPEWPQTDAGESHFIRQHRQHAAVLFDHFRAGMQLADFFLAQACRIHLIDVQCF